MSLQTQHTQESAISGDNPEASPVFSFIPHLRTVGDEDKIPTLTSTIPVTPDDFRVNGNTTLRGTNFSYGEIPGPTDETRCIIVGKEAIKHFVYVVGEASYAALIEPEQDEAKRDKLAMLSRRVVFLAGQKPTDGGAEDETEHLVDRDSESFASTLDYMTAHTFLCLYKNAENIVERLLRAATNNDEEETLEANIRNAVVDMTHTSNSRYIYAEDSDLEERIAKSLRRHLKSQIDIILDDKRSAIEKLSLELANQE